MDSSFLQDAGHTEFVLLHAKGLDMVDAPSLLQAHADNVMRAWTRDERYDLVWTWRQDSHARIVSCVDFHGSVSSFPLRFVQEFVGKEHPWPQGNSTWLLSTVSTK